MIRHTPGCWYWDFDRDGLASLRSDVSGGEAIMIDVDCYPELADRCLIAAAPDLLEALESARTYVEWAYECAFPDAEKNTEILASIDAAIARAKG